MKGMHRFSRLPTTWRYQETVLLLCSVAFLVTMFGRLAISPVVPEITSEFEVTNATIGVALTGMWLAYGLTQFPSGVLADRFGERSVILVSVSGTVITCVLIAVAPAFVVFFVCTVLLGAVAGLHFSVATTLLERTYENPATAFGVHGAGGTVAGLVAPIVVAWVAVRFGWRPAIAIVALLGIPVAILFARYVRRVEPRRPDTPMRSRFQGEPIIALLSRPAILFTLFVATVGEFVWQATASFLPTFLIEFRGQSTTLAGMVFSAYFVAQGVGQVGVGAVSDRIGGDRTLVGCMLASALGFGLLITTPSLVAIGAGVILLGVGMSFGPALFPRFLGELTEKERNTGFGLVRTVYMIVASMGSVAVGVTADAFGWAVAFGLLLALLGSVVVAFLANWAFDLGY